MVDWKQYNESRKHLNYYKSVKRHIEALSPGLSILDVGCGGTDTVHAGQFTHRCVVNREPIDVDAYQGIDIVMGEWPDVSLPRDHYDVVTCCQVLEHLTDDQIPAFVDKLKATAGVLIVSVPHLWPNGLCKYHVQDPVDLEKLTRWMGTPAKSSEIVMDDGLGRLIAVFG